MPFAPAVLRTASALYIPRVPGNAPSKKVAKRQLSHSLIPLHFVPLHSFIRSQTFCIYQQARKGAFVKAAQGAMQAQSAQSLRASASQ